MRPLTLKIPCELDGANVQSVLEHEMHMSGGHISRLKRRPSGILVNGKKAYTTLCLSAGDELVAEISDEPGFPMPRPIPIDIPVVFEDEFFMIINKPAGLAVHSSTRTPDEPTVENALAAMLAPDERPHPVSRLDRGTTGLMTVAKSGYIHERLRRLLHTDDFFREYSGIARGIVCPPDGSIALPIGMADSSTYKHAICDGGQAALTEYSTIASVNSLTLLRLVPHTGRTHQLRLHMAAIGFPLVGDWLYGSEDDRISRPALHSSSLFLRHPMTGEKLYLEAALPEDMRRLIQ